MFSIYIVLSSSIIIYLHRLLHYHKYSLHSHASHSYHFDLHHIPSILDVRQRVRDNSTTRHNTVNDYETVVMHLPVHMYQGKLYALICWLIKNVCWLPSTSAICVALYQLLIEVEPSAHAKVEIYIYSLSHHCTVST